MIGFLLAILARLWPLPKPFGNLTRPAPRESWAGRRVVGTCGTCGGELVLAPGGDAACAIGCSRVPRDFLEPKLRP